MFASLVSLVRFYGTAQLEVLVMQSGFEVAHFNNACTIFSLSMT